MLSCFSHVQHFATPLDCSLPGSSVRGNSPGKNTGAGCHAFLQGIFSTAVSRCVSYISGTGKQVLYHCCQLGSPLEWYHLHIWDCWYHLCLVDSKEGRGVEKQYIEKKLKKKVLGLRKAGEELDGREHAMWQFWRACFTFSGQSWLRYRDKTEEAVSHQPNPDNVLTTLDQEVVIWLLELVARFKASVILSYVVWSVFIYIFTHVGGEPEKSFLFHGAYRLLKKDE